MTKTSGAEVRRVGRFSLIGIANTAIDVILLNVLVHFGLAKLVANTISTTVAMAFSFFANRQYVFRVKGSYLKQTVLFFAVTAFGLYVLQNGVIYILTSVWTGPVNLMVAISKAVGLGSYLSPNFVILNSSKVVAIAVGLVWNYVMYKKVVFKNE